MSEGDEEAMEAPPQSAIMKTLRLLRFSAFNESSNPSPTTPSAGDRDTTTPGLSSRPPSPPPKPTRTPMGDYIIPPGEKPLTSLGDPAPGPSDYKPKIDLTRKAAPQYSIVGKLKKLKPKTHPGPADYDCGKDLEWKERTVTLKGRTPKSYPHTEACVEASTIGPAKYNTARTLGDSGPRFSIASKHDNIDVYGGPPNNLVQPGDTHGFETPGPNYRPNSSYWGRGPKSSFGINRRKVVAESPGPGDYDIPDPDKGPSYSLAIRFRYGDEGGTKKKIRDPAPNEYDIGSTIGKAVAKTITGRRKETSRSQSRMVPAPNTYTLKTSFDPEYKAATMSYRRFEESQPVWPGPSDYSVRHVTLKKNPVFTCRQRCKASFPDSLHYVTKSSPVESPGPGKYNVSSNIRNNENPAFSMGSRAAGHKVKGPAPNQYGVEKFHKPGAARSPAFTMGRRFDPPDSRVSPGPAAYNLQKREAGGSKYTMSKRLPKPVIGASNPAPNKYRPKSSQTIRGRRTNLGVKLKSRASPYVYSGFHTNKMAEPLTC